MLFSVIKLTNEGRGGEGKEEGEDDVLRGYNLVPIYLHTCMEVERIISLLWRVTSKNQAILVHVTLDTVRPCTKLYL